MDGGGTARERSEERAERHVDASASEPQQSLRNRRSSGDPSTTSPSSASRSTSSCSTRTKMFCRCRQPLRRRAQHQRLRGRASAHPGMLPVPNARGRRQSHPGGPGAGLRDPAVLQVGPQELLLSRQPEGVPDLPVRPAAVRRRPLPRARPRGRLRGRHHARAPGGGRREDGPRGRRRRAHRRLVGSVVDFNRAGTPLLEIVTEPDLHSPRAGARASSTLLRATIVAIGASDCDMEKGSLRCDANVSVRRAGTTALGTKTELKNMNSFRFLERGIDGGDRAADRRCWSVAARSCRRRCTSTPRAAASSSLRSKEEAHDYRYFPEPDLLPLEPSRELVEELRATLPELPRGAHRAAGARLRHPRGDGRAARPRTAR